MPSMEGVLECQPEATARESAPEQKSHGIVDIECIS
jgi:hypothetical protein